jgi:hypothetical protein
MICEEQERVYREQERLAVSMYINGATFKQIADKCPLVALEQVRALAFAKCLNIFDGTFH